MVVAHTVPGSRMGIGVAVGFGRTVGLSVAVATRVGLAVGEGVGVSVGVGEGVGSVVGSAVGEGVGVGVRVATATGAALEGVGLTPVLDVQAPSVMAAKSVAAIATNGRQPRQPRLGVTWMSFWASASLSRSHA